MEAQLEGDLSDRFHQVVANLVGPGGVSYREFRPTLKPRYGVVWRDIALGYLTLAAVCAALVMAPFPSALAAGAAALVASVVLGYVHQYVALFMHEAAHLNIARSRRTNDLLANLFLGVMQGFSIQVYRAKHFDHHRYLGAPNDPERHYFQPLDWRFFVSTLSGTRTLLEIVRLRGAAARSGDGAKGAGPRGPRWVVLAGAGFHVLLVAGAVALGRWPLGVAWTLGFLIWFPFFSMLRQILEHRDFRAAAAVDYSQTAHGALTRTFGDGPVANTLGAAGFNRHLIHHWEPQVSYTRLRELEQFLLATEVGPIVQRRRSTYASSFVTLLGAGTAGDGSGS